MAPWLASASSIPPPLSVTASNNLLPSPTTIFWIASSARALFAGLAAHSALPLEQPLTASVGLFLGAAGHAVGWPFARGGSQAIADALGLHVAFACTRVHKRGELGNAILSRWPMAGVSVVDLSFSRIERRLAMAAQFQFEGGVLDVVATHLALGDRTRHRQVRSLLEHPHFQDGPTLLLYGERDPFATRQPALAALFADGRAERMDGAGASPMQQRPADYARRLLAFLNGAEAEAS